MIKCMFHRRQRLRVYLLGVALISSACSVGDCDDVVGPSADACGELTGSHRAFFEPFAFPLPESARLEGGRAHFTWSDEVNGLCVEGPETDNTGVTTGEFFPGVATPAGLRAEARVYHAAGIRPYTDQIENLSTTRGPFQLTVRNVGLKQGNPQGGSARVIVEFYISWISSGNIDDDRALGARMLDQIAIDMHFHRAK